MPESRIASEHVLHSEVIQHPDGSTSKRLFAKLTREQMAYFKQARVEVLKQVPPTPTAVRKIVSK